MTLTGPKASPPKTSRLKKWALAREADFSVFKTRPSPKVWSGLALIALTTLGGLPSIGLCLYLSEQWHKPLISLIGVPALLVAIHAVFALGAWLSGGNYAPELVRYAARRWIYKAR